jgi:hypothetical protein
VTATGPLTPEERRLRARAAAHARWSRPGARERQRESIRAARLRHHERLVDPEGVLDEVERVLLAEHSLRAEMMGLALRSAKARRQRPSSKSTRR